MYKISLFLISLIIAASTAKATTVECTPGKLQELISSPSDITELTILGSINAADLFFIGQQLPNLQTLALPKATIKSYSGEKLYGRRSYPANAIPTQAFAGSPLKTIYFPEAEGLVIQEAAFTGSKLERVQLLNNIDSVGTGAFAGCPELTWAYMPWLKYGSHIFADCPKLETVKLSLQTLPEAAFSGCTALKTVEGSELIRNIKPASFMNCKSLQSMSTGEKLALIGERAFMGAGIQTLDIPETSELRSIGPWAFAGCQYLRIITLPESLAAIGEGAFFDCIRLTSAILPPKIREVANYMFKGARSVTSDNLDLGNIETIGDYGMAQMKQLYHLMLPETLSSVGEGAFLTLRASVIYVQKLTEVPATGENAFEDVDQPNVILYVSGDNYDAFSSAEQWREFNIQPFTGIDDTVAESLTALPQLRGRFVGTDLEVSIDGIDIEWLALYDAAGTLLKAVEPHGEKTTIPTADMGTRIYIVCARLADGRNATLKIARN